MDAFEGIMHNPSVDALHEIRIAAQSLTNIGHQLGEPKPSYYIGRMWESRQTSLIAAGFLTYEMYEEVVCRVCLDF